MSTNLSFRKLVGALASAFIVLATLTLGVNSAGAATQLPAPTGVKSITTNSTATITWNKVAGAAKYRVVYRIDANGTAATMVTPTSNSVTLKGLKSKTRYVFTVSAYNSKNVEGKRTGFVYFTTTTLAAPSGIAATTTNSTAKITWTALSNAPKYLVEFYPKEAPAKVEKTYPTTNSASFSGLLTGTAYNYKVTGINPDGTAGASSAVQTLTTKTLAASELSASNTGVPAALVGSLKPEGDPTKITNLVVTKDNTVIDGIVLKGSIRVQANNVTIRNSKIIGQGSHALGIVSQHEDFTGLTVIDSEIYNEFPYKDTVDTKAIMGANLRVDRANIHHVKDQVHLLAQGNAVVINSYFHSNIHMDPDPYFKDLVSHDDNVQLLGGENVKILANRLEGSKNAAIMVGQNNAPIKNLLVENNLIGGGACSINVGAKDHGDMANYNNVIRNNRFTRTQRISGCAIIADEGSWPTNVGNEWTTAGTPATVTIKMGTRKNSA